MSEPTGWLKAGDAELKDFWPDSAYLLPEALDRYLDAARAQCAAFAPDVEEIPGHYRLAQALQARSLARAGTVGDGGSQGQFETAPVVFPMDWTVKNLLRPEGKFSIA